MSATKKKATTAKKATTRKASARRRTSTTRRRTTTTRRTQPKVATTVGAALGTLVVALLLDASWPVRVGLVLLALLLVGGYLYLQGRRHDAAHPDVEEPAPSVVPAPPAPSAPSAPPAPSAPFASAPAHPSAPNTEDTP